MSEIEILEEIGIKAVRKLRIETLTAGEPFMINVKGLPKDQCYLEFPDQSIQLVCFSKEKNDFIPIHRLSIIDGRRLRKRLGI